MNKHLSSEEIANCLIGEESPVEQLHLRECQSCQAELESLRHAFSLYRDSGRNWSEYWLGKTDFKPRQARTGGFGKWALAGSLAIAVLAALFVRTSSAPAIEDQPFLPIPYVVSPAAYERTHVKRMSVPVAALRSAGLTIPLADPGASVQADVLLGQDGRALAVRLVSSTNFNLARRYN
jgi:hypothetical protein